MKKLMIAAAAVAAAAGAYATTGCEGCNVNIQVQQPQAQQVVVAGCNVTAYNVQFKLKTLVTKGVKNGDCQGYCMEQGTRTLDGVLWSCCTQCENWDPNTAGEAEVFQYTLWEKSGARCFTGGMVHSNAINPTSTETFNVPYSVRFMNLGAAALVYGDGKLYDTTDEAQAAWNAWALENDATEVGVNRSVQLAATAKDPWKVEFNLTKAGEKTIEVKKYGFAKQADAEAYYDDQVAAYPTYAPSLAKAAACVAYQQWRNELNVAAGAQRTFNNLYTAKNVKDEAAALAVAKAEKNLPFGWKVLTADAALTPVPAAAAVNWAARTAGTPATTEGEIASYWDTPADIALFRFGKKADKVEALWTIDTENEGVDNGFKTAESDGTADDVYLVAGGFGTTMKDGDDIVAKSISGNCAGRIVPVITVNCAGSITSMCDDWDNWCTDGFLADCATTFVSGTWTMKYIKTLRGGFQSIVPSYAGILYL